QKRMAQFGTTIAFRRALPSSERAVFTQIVLYLKKTLSLVDADVMLKILLPLRDTGNSESGNPAFE
ncbi:hypothetical protein C8J56DRAFT_788822, partial [Mycena floridula]